MERLWFGLAAGIYGLVMGCYFNTLRYRLCSDKKIWTRDCFCPSCGHPLALWEQIPVIGYLILKGKCRYCSAPIGRYYPMIEVSYAVAYALIAAAVFPHAGRMLCLCGAGELLHLIGAVMHCGYAENLLSHKALIGFLTLSFLLFCIGVGMGILVIGLTTE